jgi:NAD(P)-dependent dehydrogenase (short-subunit alcohol dehydrogenase family)
LAHKITIRQSKNANRKGKMTSKRVYLVTGSNVGLGLEATRQLALKQDTKKVYLACRTESKALAAIGSLAKDFNIPKEKLSFVPFDGSASKATIATKILGALPNDEKIDGLIFNAGGPGHDKTGKAGGPNNVLDIFQINLIGHIHLLEALKSNNNLKPNETVIIYSGSEGARGLPLYGVGTPKLPDSVDGYTDLLAGKVFKKYDSMQTYSYVKAVAALYWSAWAREHPEYFVVTVSPGATSGTAAAAQKGVPKVMSFMYPAMLGILGVIGMSHPVEVGAKRYVDAVRHEGNFEQVSSGSFMASVRGATGHVIDQTKLPCGAIFADTKTQAVAFQAVQSFV